MWKVFGRADSSAVAKVMWMLEELGLPHERTDWGGAFGGNDDPAYRAMQPAGRIPVLQLPTGDTLWESNTIVRYLAAVHPASGFLPQAALPRARVEAWMDWAGDFARAIGTLRRAYKASDATVASVTAAVEAVSPIVRVLEQRLEDRRFVAGSTLTTADFTLGVWGHRLFRSPEPVPLGSFPALRGWLSRLQARAAFQTHVVAKVSAGPQPLGGAASGS